VKITEFVNELVVPRKCLLEVSLATTSSSSEPPLKLHMMSTSGRFHNMSIPLLACGWDHRELSHFLSNCGV
jgi:hypothetical protein